MTVSQVERVTGVFAVGNDVFQAIGGVILAVAELLLLFAKLYVVYRGSSSQL